jgi:hypothetical protein
MYKLQGGSQEPPLKARPSCGTSKLQAARSSALGSVADSGILLGDEFDFHSDFGFNGLTLQNPGGVFQSQSSHLGRELGNGRIHHTLLNGLASLRERIESHHGDFSAFARGCDRLSISEQEKLEKIILPTQFQALKDFHAYLKIANYGITAMQTPPKFLPAITDEFVPRDFDLQQLLQEAPALTTAPMPSEVPEFEP